MNDFDAFILEFLFLLLIMFIIKDIISAIKKFASKSHSPQKTQPDTYLQTIIDKILILIEKENYSDIKQIATEASASYEEGINAIKYMRENNMLNDYYIDYQNSYIKKCNVQDKTLLMKYYSRIANKLQFDNIVTHLKTTHGIAHNEATEQVRRELLYLIDNNLLDGVAYNEVDDELVYYTNTPEENLIVSQECPGCGATIKLNKHSKKRCKYCNMIVEYNQKNK